MINKAREKVADAQSLSDNLPTNLVTEVSLFGCALSGSALEILPSQSRRYMREASVAMEIVTRVASCAERFPKFHAEWLRWQDRLLELLASHELELRGRWVVFHGGKILSTWPTESAAYCEAMASVGPEAGVVVSCVSPEFLVPADTG